MSLFLLYAYSILASIAAAPILSLTGIELATRDRAVQTLCVAQAALLGVLLGLGLNGDETSVVPTASGLAVSSLAYGLTLLISRRKTASVNSAFASLFAVLTAGSFLISHLFPALENHLAQIYFGDVATLSNQNALIVIALSLVSGVVLWVSHRRISEESFQLALFGNQARSTPSTYFEPIALVFLSLSVQFLGLLFTLTLLFLPTVSIHGVAKSLSKHKRLVVFIATAGTGVGFLLSILWSLLPTVPLIVISILVFGGMAQIFVFFSRVFRRRPRRETLIDNLGANVLKGNPV